MSWHGRQRHSVEAIAHMQIPAIPQVDKILVILSDIKLHILSCQTCLQWPKRFVFLNEGVDVCLVRTFSCRHVHDGSLQYLTCFLDGGAKKSVVGESNENYADISIESLLLLNYTFGMHQTLLICININYGELQSFHFQEWGQHKVCMKCNSVKAYD